MQSKAVSIAATAESGFPPELLEMVGVKIAPSYCNSHVLKFMRVLYKGNTNNPSYIRELTKVALFQIESRYSNKGSI